MMVRTQIYLPDVVHDRLKARGQILGKSMAGQVREAVERYLAGSDTPPALPDDPIWSLPDRGVDARPRMPRNVAVSHDRYLYGAITRTPRPTPKTSKRANNR